jgi:hypothetical protein
MLIWRLVKTRMLKLYEGSHPLGQKLHSVNGSPRSLGWVADVLRVVDVVDRCGVGAFETAIQPGFLVVTSMWYVRGEQAQTIALWYCECLLV